LTLRDEARIFKDLSRMMDQLVFRTGGAGIAAVFHADCLARGRHTLHRILKEELVAGMQEPLSESGRIPPWLGMYGFGEFARLSGRNCFHNYTTALYVISRR
jgi:small ligand-binding sensory domain FIST